MPAVLAAALGVAAPAHATTYYQAHSVSDPETSTESGGCSYSPTGGVVSNSDLDAEVGTLYSFVWVNGTLDSRQAISAVGHL